MPTTREMELPSLRLRPGSRKAFALRGPGESGPRDGQRRYGYRLPNRGGIGRGIVRTGVPGGKTPGGTGWSLRVRNCPGPWTGLAGRGNRRNCFLNSPPSTRKRRLKCRPPACGWGGAGIFSNIFIEMVVNCKQEMDRSGKARDGGKCRARR